MRSGSFSHDPNNHTVVVCGGVACSVMRGVRIRTSMKCKRHYPKLVVVTHLGEKNSKSSTESYFELTESLSEKSFLNTVRQMYSEIEYEM